MSYGFEIKTGTPFENKITFDSNTFATGYLIHTQTINMPNEYYNSDASGDNISDYIYKSTYPNGIGWVIVDLTNVEPTLSNISVIWEPPTSGVINSTQTIQVMSWTTALGLQGLNYMYTPPVIHKISDRVFAIKYNPVRWQSPSGYSEWNILSNQAKALWSCKVNFYGF